ncbi:MAG: YdiY family protein [Pyrinomonadaceae bacterium]
MSKFLSFILIMLLLAASSPAAFADQIILTNGDKLTGKIVKKDGDKIVIETEFAGVVTVLWSAVSKIVADEPVNIELADGQKLKGTVATTEEDAKVEVATQDAGMVSVEKQNIQTVRSQAEQASFEAEQARILNPGFGDLWTGSADLGFSMTTGNSETKALTAGVRASRETTRDKISVYGNMIQASNNTTGVKVTTANAVWFGGRYDVNISDKTFVFATADFEHDNPQKLDFRAVFGGGFGYRWIRTDRTSLDVFGGAAYNKEYFSDGTRRNSAEALIGEEFHYKLSNISDLEQRFVLYPNLSNTGEFRSIFDASVVTRLSKWLGWQVTVGNRYNSEPALGAKTNDFLFTTGIRATFGNNK